MHLWDREDWKKYYLDASVRRGLYFRVDPSVDDDVRRAVIKYGKWLRREFAFPMKVNVYIKGSKYIRALDGEKVSATCWLPYDKYEYPYIRVSAGDYGDMLRKRKKEDALASILMSISHELTHYYQWINDVKLTPIGTERQATTYGRAVVWEYAEEVKTPL